MANEPLPVAYTPEFKRNLRQLAKKYRHLHDDIQPIIEQLVGGDKPGDQITGIQVEIFKVRAGNSDARKGKSGGYRVLYQRKPDDVVLITIYSKSDQADVTAAEIRRIIAYHEDAIQETGDSGGDK